MGFSFFVTEFRRTFQVCTALILFCFIAGFIFFSSVEMSDYLTHLFEDINIGVDMIILPKGITPESMQKSLVNGQPEALMPTALFETLQKQIEDEVSHKNLAKAPLSVLAVLPFHNEQGKIEIAKVGDENFIRDLDKTVWANYKFKNLTEVKNQLQPQSVYATEEWGDKTIFSILASGNKEALGNLKKLIDRRTIAQAYFLDPGRSDNALKLQKLKMGLQALTGIILISLLLGIIISFQKLHIQRKFIFQTFDEMKKSQQIKFSFYMFQLLLLLIVPVFLGVMASQFVLPLIKNLF